jgi:chemotaxis protein MotB
MALARGRRERRTIDYWPGFVDALSTLLLAIMFLLSVFVLAQFLLSREISGKDEVLGRLNSQINELTQLAGAGAGPARPGCARIQLAITLQASLAGRRERAQRGSSNCLSAAKAPARRRMRAPASRSQASFRSSRQCEAAQPAAR